MFHINGDYYNAGHVVSITQRGDGESLLTLINGNQVVVEMETGDLAEFIYQCNTKAPIEITYTPLAEGLAIDRQLLWAGGS